MEKNTSIDDIIDSVISNIEKSNKEYISYYKKSTDHNFRTFLLSIIEQKNEHLKRIKEIKQLGNLETVFKDKPEIPEDSSMKYTADINYLDFLKLLIQRHEFLSKIYNKLMEASKNQDINLLFKRLEFEIKKQISIISNRYELEKIKMG